MNPTANEPQSGLPERPPVNAGSGLRFKPLTTGLGFHPFSDGLPYAPVKGAGQKPSASSAKPAARARPTAAPLEPPSTLNMPFPSAPKVSAAAARAATSLSSTAPFPDRPVLPAATGGLARTIAQGPQGFVAKPQVRGVTVGVAPLFPATSLVPTAPGFLYLLKRVLAFTLDLVLVSGLCVAAFGWTLWRQKIPAASLVSPDLALLFFTFLGVFSWAMIVAQELAFGTTVGKRLFGLVLIGSPAAIFLRAFFFLPSAGFAGIGLLWSIFDEHRRCWHDLAAEVQPTEIADL